LTPDKASSPVLTEKENGINILCDTKNFGKGKHGYRKSFIQQASAGYYGFVIQKQKDELQFI